MSIRRVVTANVDGKSRLLIDGPAPTTDFYENIWCSDPSNALGRELTAADDDIHVGVAGAAKFRVSVVPPDEVLRRKIAEMSGEDVAAAWDGFHKSDTIDYLYVLEGNIGLQLDEGEEVTLSAGDCIVQRGTNHAWRNRSNRPVRLLGVMINRPGAAGS